jgi:phage terminase small subunit
MLSKQCSVEEAMRIAGYSQNAHRLDSNGNRLMKHPLVAAAINEGRAKQNAKLELNGERVLLELMRLGFVDISQAYDKEGKLLPLHEMPEDCRRAIEVVETEQLWEGRGHDAVQKGVLTKVKFAKKTAALELLARNLKLLTDRVEVSDIIDEDALLARLMALATK